MDIRMNVTRFESDDVMTASFWIDGVGRPAGNEVFTYNGVEFTDPSALPEGARTVVLRRDSFTGVDITTLFNNRSNDNYAFANGHWVSNANDSGWTKIQ